MMQYITLFRFGFVILTASFAVLAMDSSTDIMKRLEIDIRTVYKNATTDDSNISIIAEAGKRILFSLKSWPENRPVPEKLLKAAGAAIGQFCYFSPYSLQFLEYIILPYLNNKSLTYEDLKTPHCTYTFGLKYSRNSLNPNMLTNMRNGQTISTRYHLNYSVVLNRLLSEFKGSFLLIGGGENCECENASRHPNEHFYSVDVNNIQRPDMIINAVYLPHLYTFPEEKFDFIWFEHCSVPEMLADLRVFEQYFRFSKPGALFLYQSNFLLPDETTEKIVKENIQRLLEIFKAYKFAVLENERYSTTRNGQTVNYQQVIAMKPVLAQGALKQFSSQGPEITIDHEALAKPTVNQAMGLWHAKVLSGQFKLILAFPLDEILSRLPKEKT